MEDEHLRSLCFGDYMHPEAEKKIYDEIPDVTLLTKAMDHYLKVWITYLPSDIMIKLKVIILIEKCRLMNILFLGI